MMEQSGGLKVIIHSFINHDVLQAQYGELNIYDRFKTPDGTFNILLQIQNYCHS
jgi:hypothetical protein